MEVIGYILGGIILSPVIISIFLILGFYELFLLFKNKGKRELPREEQNLLDFMINKMCCKQKWDILEFPPLFLAGFETFWSLDPRRKCRLSDEKNLTL